MVANWIGLSEHRGLEHAGGLRDCGLHFSEADILAGHLDDVIHATDEPHLPVYRLLDEITGAKPGPLSCLIEHASIDLGGVKISLKQVGPPSTQNEQLSRAARDLRAARGVNHANRATLRRGTNHVGPGFGFVIVCDDRNRFGHPIQLAWKGAAESPELSMVFGSKALGEPNVLEREW